MEGNTHGSHVTSSSERAGLVHGLSRALDQRGLGLKELEERILEFVNRIGIPKC